MLAIIAAAAEARAQLLEAELHAVRCRVAPHTPAAQTLGATYARLQSRLSRNPQTSVYTSRVPVQIYCRRAIAFRHPVRRAAGPEAAGPCCGARRQTPAPTPQAKAAAADAGSRDSQQRRTIAEQTAAVGAAAGRVARLQERLDAALAAAAEGARPQTYPNPTLCCAQASPRPAGAAPERARPQTYPNLVLCCAQASRRVPGRRGAGSAPWDRAGRAWQAWPGRAPRRVACTLGRC